VNTIEVSAESVIFFRKGKPGKGGVFLGQSSRGGAVIPERSGGGDTIFSWGLQGEKETSPSREWRDKVIIRARESFARQGGPSCFATRGLSKIWRRQRESRPKKVANNLGGRITVSGEGVPLLLSKVGEGPGGEKTLPFFPVFVHRGEKTRSYQNLREKA